MAKTGNSSSTYRARRKQLNIGILICTVILIYLVVYFCVYFFGGRTAIYEVSSGAVASRYDAQYTGLAFREETVVPSAGNGYINFFVGDATPITVGQQTYLLDSTGKISAQLEEAAKNQAILSEDNLNKIKDTIYDFDTSFDEQRFFDTYSFKYRIESQILDLINGSVFDSINAQLAEAGENAFQVVNSDIAGVIMHYTDGFEGRTVDSVESADFKKSEYQKKLIKANDLIGEGDPVYKVVTSENWSLVIQISDPEIFADASYVNIEFLKDNVKASADVSTFTKAGNNYAVLTFEKYMIRYIADRYLQIRIEDDTDEGLKVPKTSIAERQYYAVPIEYQTQGGNSTDNGFFKEVVAEDGSTSVTFITPRVIRATDTTCYVDTSELNDGDIFVLPESGSRYQIGNKENLQGVYTVNNGYATFKLVDVIGENASFYIISSKLPGGVRLYDQVIRDGNTITEGDVVNR